MSSNLHQIQLTYDQVNDRLLLCFNTQDFLEYRFWITRRLLKGLWEILQQVGSNSTKNEMQKRMQSQQAQEKIQPEMQSAEANKYGTRMSRRPLGDEPMLLTKVMATPGENQRVNFRLEDAHGTSVDFAGDAFLVSVLSQLLIKIIPKTDWELHLKEAS